jgi:hypothetical protein
MSLTVARVRAVLGALFAAAGILIAVQLLAKPAPLNQKAMGLAFAAVLIALGVVRIRMYVMTRRRLSEK